MPDGRGAFLSEPGDGQCSARKPYSPQEGERCSLLPHAHWMPHSWVPWSLALELQAKHRDQHRRLGYCDACESLGS